MNKYLTYDDYILLGGMMSEYDFNCVVLAQTKSVDKLKETIKVMPL